jgi:hypothetical protein
MCISCTLRALQPGRVYSTGLHGYTQARRHSQVGAAVPAAASSSYIHERQQQAVGHSAAHCPTAHGTMGCRHALHCMSSPACCVEGSASPAARWLAAHTPGADDAALPSLMQQAGSGRLDVAMALLDSSSWEVARCNCQLVEWAREGRVELCHLLLTRQGVLLVALPLLHDFSAC